jgi:Mrp family chromosome partitioning ATPase
VDIAIAGGSELSARSGETLSLPSVSSAAGATLWYSDRIELLERELLKARSAGLRPAHPLVVRLEADIKLCRDQMAALPQPTDKTVSQPQGDGPAAGALSERAARLRTLLQSAEKEMRQLASQRDTLKDLETQVATSRQQLLETSARLDALATESAMGGRLTVVSGGQRPMTANLDNRLKMMGVGAAMGAAAPFGLLIVAAAVRRRYRSGEDLAADLAQRAPFVAVLPRVDTLGATSSIAARCVHDVRTRMQPRGTAGPHVHMVTSAGSGEGKTALTMALGFSFAAAGFRTLLVDGDLAARGLSLAFEAGEVPGLLEATLGGMPYLLRNRAGLSVLAAGQSTPTHACSLVPAAIRQVIGSLREQFDVVLIDGDPLLTGVTASAIAPHTDGVVLAVANGQQPSRVQQAVHQLEHLGLTLSAAVFNFADSAALDPDVRQRDAAAVGERALPERVRRFGALVGGVLASLSLMRDEDLELTAGEANACRNDQAANLGAAGHDAQERWKQGRSAA